MMFRLDTFFQNRPWSCNWAYVFVARHGYRVEDMREVRAWLESQFGHDSHRWSMEGWRVHFRDQTDASAFKIRWG